jgi:hypothetical protein
MLGGPLFWWHIKGMKAAKPYMIAFLLLVAATVAAIKIMGWVRAHPEHFQGRDFDLKHPIGWATRAKLVALAQRDGACFAVMERGEVPLDRKPVVGEGQCRASQRMVMEKGAPFPQMRPVSAAPACAVSAGLMLWHRTVVRPEAEALLGARVVQVENLGSYNCRKVRGGNSPSQHSSANAIDISAFVLSDGRRISVKDDWDDEGVKGAFLRSVRDGACDIFSTTLSPDYNAAHADHFHFDLAARRANWSVCR